MTASSILRSRQNESGQRGVAVHRPFALCQTLGIFSQAESPIPDRGIRFWQFIENQGIEARLTYDAPSDSYALARPKNSKRGVNVLGSLWKIRA